MTARIRIRLLVRKLRNQQPHLMARLDFPFPTPQTTHRTRRVATSLQVSEVQQPVTPHGTHQVEAYSGLVYHEIFLLLPLERELPSGSLPMRLIPEHRFLGAASSHF